MVFLLALVFFSLSTSVTALPMNQWPRHDQSGQMVPSTHPGAPVSPAARPMGSGPGPGPEHHCTMRLGSEYRQQAEHDPMIPHHPHAATLPVAPVGYVARATVTTSESDSESLEHYAFGCWTPDSPVSEHCSFNVTSFKLLIGQHRAFCPAFCVFLMTRMKNPKAGCYKQPFASLGLKVTRNHFRILVSRQLIKGRKVKEKQEATRCRCRCNHS